MSVSVLVVSDTSLEGLPAQAQTLVFPHNGEVQIYHRVSNGSKGRGQAWRKTMLTDLPTDLATHEPCATVITERDRQMLELNTMTNLGIKALYSLETANKASVPMAHNEAVEGIVTMIIEGDTRLNDYITDKRRANGVVIKPLAKAIETETVSVLDIPITNKDRVIEVREQSEKQMLEMVSVPDPKWAKEYINRRIEGTTDFDIYEYALRTGKNVLCEGHAGSGKTMSFQAFASHKGMRYFNLACHIGIEPSHMVGRWIPTADGHFKWQDGVVTEIGRAHV